MSANISATSPARPRRRLGQVGPACILGAILILIPGVPTMLADAVSDTSGDVDADGPLTLESAEGHAITALPPVGWRVRDRANSATFWSGEARVGVDVYDRNGRDVEAMAERLRRQDRINGVSAAPDGGRVSTADGALTGSSCVLTTETSVGSCAVLADGEVVVFVQSLGTPDRPALPLVEVLASLSKKAS